MKPHAPNMRLLQISAALALLGVSWARSAQPLAPLPQGNVSAVTELLERVLPGSSSQFQLTLLGDSTACAPGVTPPCFALSDASSKVAVAGSTVSELTAGLGVYFREVCNMTIGWPRGGGSNIFTPSPWPAVGSTLARRRVAPYSYIENVCTHSYSLVWYDWPAWSAFIDWMALSGINLALAMTGQEEVQYKVFQQLGLDDVTIRTWFNGPAFLTWSRGQNEYGNNICGPLPRSWMKAQWELQRSILARMRSLAIVGELPGFQGNVPYALATLHNDKNITQQGATGWMVRCWSVFLLWPSARCLGTAGAPYCAPTLFSPSLRCFRSYPMASFWMRADFTAFLPHVLRAVLHGPVFRSDRGPVDGDVHRGLRHGPHLPAGRVLQRRHRAVACPHGRWWHWLEGSIC